MGVKVERLEKNTVQLEIEIEPDVFSEGMRKSFIKNTGKFSIPGFRKGKAPQNVVERYYGEHVLYEDAVSFVFPDAYQKAIEENDIHPVDNPDVDIKQIGSGQNLIITAKVVVKPDVVLGEYKGVKAEKLIRIVSDRDVDAEVDKAVERNARVVTVEDRGVQDNDIAVIDFEGSIDGKPFDGGKGENFSLTIGSGQFIPGFEEQLIGMMIGSERTLTLKFPDDYHEKDVAGKETVFVVSLKEIKVRELPAVDDEFAKDISEFDTIDAYKADLRKKLEERSESEAKHKLEDDIIDAINERSEVDIPQVMIDKQVDGYMRDFEMRLGMQYGGLTLDRFLQFTGRDIATFREQYVKQAENAVKTQLVLEKISLVENIIADEDETQEEIKKLAEGYQQSLDEFKNNLNDEDIEYINKTVISRKTLELLTANAEIEERRVTAEELAELRKKDQDASEDASEDTAVVPEA